MKRVFSLLLIAMMLVGMLAACGEATPTTAPQTSDNTTPAAATMPAATAVATVAAPVADTAVVPAATAAATIAATEAAPSGVTAPAITGDVTLWHAYSTGGTEDEALTKLIDAAKAANPDANITVLQVPFGDVFSKFENEVSAGEGPDLLLAPNDSLGQQVRKNLLLPLDEQMADYTGWYAPNGIEGMSVDGKLYGVPESFKAVALYYNTETMPTPPATTDELMEAVKGGKKLVVHQNIYHNFGYLQAFGGTLFDDSGKCAANTGGPEMLQFLKDLKAAGAIFTADESQGNAQFTEGKADMIINGPWVLGDFRKGLGDKLGVAAIPTGPGGPAGPLTGVDGFVVGGNSQNVEGAVALALFLTSPASQQVYTDVAGHVPSAASGVTINDKNVEGFAQAAANGVPRPHIAELDNFWTPFADAVTKVIDGDADPAAAITEACAAMDTANKK